MPGALLMVAVIWLYGLGAVDLVQFGFIFRRAFCLGWIYLFVSPLFLHARFAGTREKSIYRPESKGKPGI